MESVLVSHASQTMLSVEFTKHLVASYGLTSSLHTKCDYDFFRSGHFVQAAYTLPKKRAGSFCTILYASLKEDSRMMHQLVRSIGTLRKEAIHHFLLYLFPTSSHTCR